MPDIPGAPLPSQKTIRRLARSRSPGRKVPRAPGNCWICMGDHGQGQLYSFCEEPCSAAVHLDCFQRLRVQAATRTGLKEQVTTCVSCKKPFILAPVPEPTVLDVALDALPTWRIRIKAALGFMWELSDAWYECMFGLFCVCMTLASFRAVEDWLAYLLSPVSPVLIGPLRENADLRSEGAAVLFGTLLGVQFFFGFVLPALRLFKRGVNPVAVLWYAYRKELLDYRRGHVLDAAPVGTMVV